MRRKLIILGLLFFLFISLSTFKYLFQKENIVSKKNLYQENSLKYNPNTWAEFIRIHEISDTKGLEVHINNQTDLDDYLIKTGNDLSADIVWFDNDEDIVFPTGMYKFNKKSEFYFISNSGDVNFNNSTFLIGTQGALWLDVVGNQHYRTFKNLTVYGSVDPALGDTGDGYYSSKNITRVGTKKSSETQSFYLRALKASNMFFENLEFNNAHADNYHLFDIMGCDNITFRNITSRGYLGNWTKEQIKDVYYTNSHTLFSELIQIDISAEYAFGSQKFLSEEFESKYFNKEMVQDNIASKNIDITNVRSTGYSGLSGQAIIDGVNYKTYKPYAATIGAHSVEDDPYQNISLKNNYFENVIHADGILDKTLAPIHFSVVSLNTLNNLYMKSSEEQSKYIKADDVWQNTDIEFYNNKYVSCSKEFHDPEYPEEKLDYSPVLAAFSKDNKAVSKVELKDENNKTINTYDAYYPEEAVYKDYVFENSEYKNNTLIRNYRKVKNEVITIEKAVDENGYELDNLFGYTLKEVKTDSETVEKLSSGDSITVKHITNVYEKPDHMLLVIPHTPKFTVGLNTLIGLVFLMMVLVLGLIFKNEIIYSKV